jgi:enamine deaminase RidA (YjgF/YER057c/UK114 family)
MEPSKVLTINEQAQRDSQRYRFLVAARQDQERFAASESVELIRKCIDAPANNQQHVALVEEGAEILALGTAFPEALPDSKYLSAWKIDGLTIGRGVEGDEVAASMLRHLLDRVRQARSPIVWCDVRPDAEALFRSFGFTGTTSELAANEGIRMTCRGDGVVRMDRTISTDDIIRVGTLARLSRAVVFNRMAHIGGLLPNRADVSVAEQTREILEKIDAVLKAAGTDRSRLISATVWIKDLQHIGEMNSSWEEWLPPGAAPARACVQAVPGSKEFEVEIAAIAAV